MTSKSSKCETCNKSTISLALFRPSPIAKNGKLVPPGAESVQSDETLMMNLLPDRRPTESRFVLRFLRAGYLYVYLPKPPPGVKSWLVYRVTEHADLYPEGHGLFTKPLKDEACTRNGHNATGIKLLHIPQGHKVSDLWMAYSANLWSEKLKTKNKANPEAMQYVSLDGCSPNTFKPTTENLLSKVLECAVGILDINGRTTHEFNFEGIGVVGANAMADNLVRAAACHPLTKGKELGVVLRDPVGIATELNNLRVLRNEVAKAELAKPDKAWALTSLQMLEGLRRIAFDEANPRSWDAVSPLRTKAAFDESKGLPRGTEWIQLSAEERDGLLKAASGTGAVSAFLLSPYKRAFENENLGRVVYPDHEERAARWLEERTVAAFERWRKYVDEDAIKTWREELDAHMRSAHSQPLERMEADWWGAREDVRFNNYFALHFDDRDRNQPTQAHSPGTTYAQEWERSTTPQPLAEGDVLARYLGELRKKPTDATAIGWRSLMGNQFDLLKFAEDYAVSQRQDKLHDLGAGVLTGVKEKLSPTDIRYGWIAHAGFVTSSLTITQSWSAALTAATKAMPLVADMRLITSALMVSQTLAMARESAVNGTWLKTPIIVTVKMPLRDALNMIDARRAKASAIVKAAQGNPAAMDSPAVKAAQQELDALPSKKSLKAAAGKRGDRLVNLSLLSDNHELAQLGGDPRAAMKAGAGAVAAGSGAAKLPVTAATLVVSESQFAQMLARQPERIRQAADAMRELAQLGKGGTLTLAGQIGLLGVWINGWGFASNLDHAIKSDGDWLHVFNTFDSFFGVLAGTSQIAEAALTASLVNRLGAEAAMKAVPILGLKALTSGAGAASGFVVMVGQGIKAARAHSSGDIGAFRAYAASGAAFFGFATTNTIQFVGVFSEFMIARGSSAAIWRTGAGVALRVGARVAGVRILGLAALGLTGWGLVFLAAGLLFEVGAILLTPDDLQKHVRRSRFGKGPDKFMSMKEEFEALDALLGKPTPEPAAAALPSKTNEPIDASRALA